MNEEKLILQGVTTLWKASLLKKFKENPEEVIDDYQKTITENSILKIKLNRIKEYVNEIVIDETYSKVILEMIGEENNK